MRGGAREGAGRPASSRKYFKIRLTDEEMRMLRLMGGSKWIQDQIKAIGEKKMTAMIDTTRFTKEEQNAFIEGWEEAGGYMDDADGENPCPWCCPWDSAEIIEVTGSDVKDWGRQYWIQCKPEVEAALAEEAASADEE